MTARTLPLAFPRAAVSPETLALRMAWHVAAALPFDAPGRHAAMVATFDAYHKRSAAIDAWFATPCGRGNCACAVTR